MKELRHKIDHLKYLYTTANFATKCFGIESVAVNLCNQGICKLTGSLKYFSNSLKLFMDLANSLITQIYCNTYIKT